MQFPGKFGGAKTNLGISRNLEYKPRNKQIRNFPEQCQLAHPDRELLLESSYLKVKKGGGHFKNRPDVLEIYEECEAAR